MGKYMKKSKITSDVAVMDVVSLSPQCSLGVRTRAKTLALQRQQESQKSQPLVDDSSFSYLELRSRRLEKPPLLVDAKKSQLRVEEGKPGAKISLPNSRFRVRSMESVDSVALKGYEGNDQNDAGLEASFGENNLDIEARDRSTRESTPCSLTDPSSTTRRSQSTSTKNEARRNIPTPHEMEEFFAIAEQHQQRIFMDKYNFDVSSDSPLPGRYDWVQVMP